MPEGASPGPAGPRLLLYAGAAIVILGLAAGVLGLLLLTGDSGEQTTAGTDVPMSSVPPSTTTTAGQSTPEQRPDRTASTGASPGFGSTTVAPLDDRGRPPDGTSTTTAGAEPTPPGTISPGGDARTRLAKAADEAGYPVLQLALDDWQLTTVDLGVFDDQLYVDSVYRRGGDYLNVAQGPLASQPALPNATPVSVRGQPAESLDMGGGVALVQWSEQGSRVRITSDLAQDELLNLLEKLRLVPAQD